MTPFSSCLKAGCAAIAIFPLCVPVASLAAAQSGRHFATLHRFSGADGNDPAGPLVQDSSGNLYGETENGGCNNAGVVYELSRHKTRWTETVLHNFSMADGATPLGGLTLDDQGNLYGSEFGGPSYGGGVFEISPGMAGTWNFAQLYRFAGLGPFGSNPYGGVLRDDSGNLYGTNYYGGAHGRGTVFELSPAQGGGWMPSALHSFHDKPDGAYPAAGLVRDATGNLYGTTSEGGNGHCGDGEGDKGGCGTVFAVTRAGQRFAETRLYNFQREEQNSPAAPLTFGPGGILYGTADYDVFVLTPQEGGGWQKQIVYEFKEGIAGTITSSGVTLDAAGNLYGTTTSSGLDGYSTAYELSPPVQQGGSWTHRTLVRFGKGFGAPQPQGGILIAADGALYGVANGSPGFVFAIR
jgi:uncharacterized repeat protein (TIGR03803 family)